MNGELLQAIIDVIFKGNMLYLAPLIFLLMAVLFTDKLVDLLFNAIAERRRYR